MVLQEVTPQWNGAPHNSTSSFEFYPSWNPTLTWDASGQKFFESGLDHGVLYTDEGGVAWNGLISVTEKPEKFENRTVYFDGQKVANVVVLDEFAATIEAFTYPDEFAPFIGEKPFTYRSGLIFTGQPRRVFDLSYRTKIGNDVNNELDYKLHLVYNALVLPGEVAHTTLSEESEPITFSWDITTTPVKFAGQRPTAHVVLDMRKVPRLLRENLEQILYGFEDEPPRMPTPEELIDIFNSVFTLTITDHGDGRWTATSLDSIVYMTDPTTFTIDYPTAEFLDDDYYEVSSG